MDQRVQGPWARGAHLEPAHPGRVARSAAGKAPSSVVFTYRHRLEAGVSCAGLITWVAVPSLAVLTAPSSSPWV